MPGTPFQPSPYLPSAKRPSDSTPQAPLTPWTEMAPTGSSTFSVPSTKNTATQTSTPEMAPISIDTGAVTNAQGAVIATRPASMPLAIMLGSGFPYRTSCRSSR